MSGLRGSVQSLDGLGECAIRRPDTAQFLDLRQSPAGMATGVWHRGHNTVHASDLIPAFAFMLKVSNLSCSRGGRTLFTDLEFTVSAGGWVFLKGSNGAGKTTLLRTLCGLSPAETGELRWNDTPVRQLGGDFRREVFYLGHANALQEALSVQENLAFYAAMAGQSADAAATGDALARLGVRACQWRLVRHLSQGQKRRVALSRLLQTSAPLWILDEPFVALDAQAVQALSDIIAAHLKRGGMAILTSHQAVDIGHVQPQVVELGA